MCVCVHVCVMYKCVGGGCVRVCVWGLEVYVCCVCMFVSSGPGLEDKLVLGLEVSVSRSSPRPP